MCFFQTGTFFINCHMQMKTSSKSSNLKLEPGNINRNVPKLINYVSIIIILLSINQVIIAALKPETYKAECTRAAVTHWPEVTQVHSVPSAERCYLTALLSKPPESPTAPLVGNEPQTDDECCAVDLPSMHVSQR